MSDCFYQRHNILDKRWPLAFAYLKELAFKVNGIADCFAEETTLPSPQITFHCWFEYAESGYLVGDNNDHCGTGTNEIQYPVLCAIQNYCADNSPTWSEIDSIITLLSKNEAHAKQFFAKDLVEIKALSEQSDLEQLTKSSASLTKKPSNKL